MLVLVLVVVVFGFLGTVGHGASGAAIDHGLIGVQLDVVVVLQFQILRVL
jgi:hypothetical protein